MAEQLIQGLAVGLGVFVVVLAVEVLLFGIVAVMRGKR